MRKILEDMQKDFYLKQIKSDSNQEEIYLILKNKDKTEYVLMLLREYPVSWEEIKPLILADLSLETIKNLCEINLKTNASLNSLFNIIRRV